MGMAFTLLIMLVSLACLLPGCAPGPPVSPGFGPGIGAWLGWILAVLILLALLWFISRGNSSGTQKDHDYLTNALNKINERLKSVEDKIEQIERLTK